MPASTIIVSPRERFSSVLASLDSLFASVSDDVPVVLVEGGTPEAIRAQIRARQTRRPFEHVALPYMVTPNEARNIGGRKARTEYVVFTDNDIHYEPGWLEALERNAAQHEADAVAPLIFIGPSEERLIHHAGGVLEFRHDADGEVLTERHRLMNRKYAEVHEQLEELAPVENEVCEFHCALVRRAFFERLGGFDERLITRDHMDFALRAREAGGRVTFEKDSHVTYMAFEPFNRLDLTYHLFRWSDRRTVASIRAFESTWGVRLNEQVIRHAWIEHHRDRAWAYARPVLRKLLGRKRFRRWIAARTERQIDSTSERLRPARSEPYVPPAPAVADAKALFSS